jgi:hypothetical protein
LIAGPGLGRKLEQLDLVVLSPKRQLTVTFQNSSRLEQGGLERRETVWRDLGFERMCLELVKSTMSFMDIEVTSRDQDLSST